MISVEDASDGGTSGAKSEEVVEVVGFGCTVQDFDDAELGILLCHLAQFSLEGLDWLGCIIDQVDSEFVLWVNNFFQGVHDLALDDILFIWQVGDHHHIHDWKLIVGAGKLAIIGVDFVG